MAKRPIVQLDQLPADVAETLKSLAPGSYVSVPSERTTVAEQRRDQVVELRRAKMTWREIAMRVGVTERRAMQIGREALSP